MAKLDTSLTDPEYLNGLMQGFSLAKDNYAPTPSASISPFQEFADKEGFILVYVERSYKILAAMDIRIPNYYELCEKKARIHPELAADLYAYLREGMALTPEQFLETHNNLATILKD